MNLCGALECYNGDMGFLRINLLISFLLFSSFSMADNYALLVGGTGEDFEKTNFFEKDFLTYREGLTSRGWNVTTLFDGNKYRIPNAGFDRNADIDTQLEKILKTAKKGDQVLLVAHAHGMASELFKPAHNICTEDPEGYNTARFQRAASQLAAKGVKVTLSDLSCYSGNTQDTSPGDGRDLMSGQKAKIEKPGYCIVTLASSNYVSVCSSPDKVSGFTNAFMKLPPPSKKLNMEDQFLTARLADHSATNMPMISTFETPILKGWKEYFQLADPADMNHDSHDFHSNSVGCFECMLRDSMNKGLDKLVHDVGPIKARLLDGDIADLKKKLEVVIRTKTKVNQVQKTYDDSLKQKTGLDFSQVVDLVGLNQIANSGVNPKDVSWLDPETRSVAESYLKQKVSYDKKFKSVMDHIASEKKERDSIESTLHQNAEDLMAAERKLYDDYYHLYEKKGQNPCSSFQL